MISLRNFTHKDIDILKKYNFKDSSAEDLQKMIDKWNTKKFDSHYFEMFALENAGQVVGFVSLVE